MRTSFTLVPGDGAQRSDIYSFAGTGAGLFVLQLTIGNVEADNYLGWLDEETNLWVNAVDGNTGNNAAPAQQGFLGTFAQFQAGHGANLADYIGAWGRTDHSVWAVLNHNSDFAVIPEPAVVVFLVLDFSRWPPGGKNAEFFDFRGKFSGNPPGRM